MSVYNELDNLRRSLEASRAMCANYLGAIRNHEKGIKRLRNGIRSGQQAKIRVRELENLILKRWCGQKLDDCAKRCPVDMLELHMYGRDIAARRGR